jgi:hypothetical protein
MSLQFVTLAQMPPLPAKMDYALVTALLLEIIPVM